MKGYLVRGVPASLQQDGWWMDGVEPRKPAPRTGKRTGQGWLIPVLLVMASLGACLLLSGTPIALPASSDASVQHPAPVAQPNADGAELGFRDGVQFRSLPGIRPQPGCT